MENPTENRLIDELNMTASVLKDATTQDHMREIKTKSSKDPVVTKTDCQRKASI